MCLYNCDISLWSNTTAGHEAYVTSDGHVLNPGAEAVAIFSDRSTAEATLISAGFKKGNGSLIVGGIHFVKAK